MQQGSREGENLDYQYLHKCVATVYMMISAEQRVFQKMKLSRSEQQMKKVNKGGDEMKRFLKEQDL